MPLDDGKCDASHAAWSAPACGYHSNLYLFATEKVTPCNSSSRYCWKAYGPLSAAFPGGTWGTIRPDMDAYGIASKTWIVTGTNPYTVQADLRRCAKFDELFTERNRTYLSVSVLMQSKVNHAYCAGGATTQLTAQSWYAAEYYGDPYTAAEGISPTLYLKRFRHFDARYCVDAADIGGEALWELSDPFAYSQVLSGTPCPLPSTMAVVRTA
jgi:hypothetical protein